MAPSKLKAPMAEVDKQVQLETLLAEISTLFINLSADQIDSEIVNAQRRICEFLEIDRSTLWQESEEGQGTMLLTHIYQPADVLQPPDHLNLMDYWPWVLQKLMEGETIILSKMNDLPPEASQDRESFALFEAKSGVYIPLSVGKGPLFGVLTFAVVRSERAWAARIVKVFTLLAQVFSNALVRKKTEKALRESETRLILATKAAGAGLWSMDINTGSVWVNEQTRNLFHFSPDGKVTEKSFYKLVHVEDRDRLRRVIQSAVTTGEHFQCDFRILLPDGMIRWISARGQRYSGLAGKTDRLLGVSIDITKNKQVEKQLEAQLYENEVLKQRLEYENVYLKEEVKLLTEHSEILGKSDAIKNVLGQAEQVAKTESTVLVLGETGTGKELLARAIHTMSIRKDLPMVTINCASLPPSLIENELFGREKGAYTGAITKMIGRFELANTSTLFLDEIGELSLDLQSKLLRVLEEGKFERLGSTTSQQIDVRIIAATNRDLEQEVKAGRFRQDLFYRLNVFPILMPPLRDRSEDIPLLCRVFVREFEKKLGKQIERIPHKIMDSLMSYSWPGNVRELRNIIERAMILTKKDTLFVELPKNVNPEPVTTENLEDIIRREILAVLEKTRWRVAGKGGAADLLGLKRSTLYSKMKKLGISRTEP